MHRGQRGGHPTLAKSLPVNVPTFPAFIRKAIPDQGDDQVRNNILCSNLNISSNKNCLTLYKILNIFSAIKGST